jgi:flagellum-specific peptidoglycan hydrolase FlgJ
VLNIKNKQQFINLIKPYAIELEKKIGVPYEFILAQTGLETGFGKSTLFTKYYNIGGIKATGNDKFVTMNTNEYINGILVNKPQKFAVFNDLNDSLAGYSRVLTNRYFKKYQFKTTNPFQYAELLQSGSPKYATDINYVSKIKKLITEVQQIINK